jgi:SAM-dependent methyltransferase
MRIGGWQVKVFGGGMKKVEFVLPYVRGKEVLDLGIVAHVASACAQPNWLHRHVAGASCRCVGVDTQEDGVRALQDQGYDVRVADAQSLAIDDRFDVIVAGDVIEHLHDLRGFFSSVTRHLRPEGRLLITTANPWFFVRVAQALLTGRVYENPEHTAWYSLGTLRELLRRYQFVVEHAEYGSSEHFLYWFLFFPRIVRHTSIWLVCKRIDET